MVKGIGAGYYRLNCSINSVDALLISQGDEPQIWAEFRPWLLQRFGDGSEAETVRRLQELKWRGSLDQLCNRFADIVSQELPLF